MDEETTCIMCEELKLVKELDECFICQACNDLEELGIPPDDGRTKDEDVRAFDGNFR